MRASLIATATIDMASKRPQCVEVRASHVILRGLTLKNAQQHGLRGAPIYAEVSNQWEGKGRFQLAPQSPGYDGAVRLPNFNEGYTGKGPDIGAHEADTPPMQFGTGAYRSRRSSSPTDSASVSTAPHSIRPGEVWPDDRGRHIQAHGGGIIKRGDTFYWFGEDRSRDNERGKRYVSCYSSKNLADWTFRNQVFKLADPENFGPAWVLERPKVCYNARTKQYVMYMHIDGPAPGERGEYKLARVGVATCDAVDGDYKYLRSFRPLGQESRDIGQFIDDDGSAYLIFEDRPAGGFHIARLSDDYLTVEKDVCLIRAPLEGGAVVHFNGLYYMIGSALTGWRPNPNQYATAPSLERPWSEFRDIAPPETNTYGSQSTMLVKVVGTKTTTVIFMGDVWKPRTQWDSRYLWMPLEIGEGKLRLPEPHEWTINVETGEAAIRR